MIYVQIGSTSAAAGISSMCSVRSISVLFGLTLCITYFPSSFILCAYIIDPFAPLLFINLLILYKSLVPPLRRSIEGY